MVFFFVTPLPLDQTAYGRSEELIFSYVLAKSNVFEYFFLLDTVLYTISIWPKIPFSKKNATTLLYVTSIRECANIE